MVRKSTPPCRFNSRSKIILLPLLGCEEYLHEASGTDVAHILSSGHVLLRRWIDAVRDAWRFQRRRHISRPPVATSLPWQRCSVARSGCPLARTFIAVRRRFASMDGVAAVRSSLFVGDPRLACVRRIRAVPSSLSGGYHFRIPPVHYTYHAPMIKHATHTEEGGGTRSKLTAKEPSGKAGDLLSYFASLLLRG